MGNSRHVLCAEKSDPMMQHTPKTDFDYLVFNSDIEHQFAELH